MDLDPNDEAAAFFCCDKPDGADSAGVTPGRKSCLLLMLW
jgi:hypothetical protein